MKVIILYYTPGLLAVVFLNIKDISLDLTLDILSVGLGGAGWLAWLMAGPINKSCPIHQRMLMLRRRWCWWRDWLAGLLAIFYSRYRVDHDLFSSVKGNAIEQQTYLVKILVAGGEGSLSRLRNKNLLVFN